MQPRRPPAGRGPQPLAPPRRGGRGDPDGRAGNPRVPPRPGGPEGRAGDPPTARARRGPAPGRAGARPDPRTQRRAVRPPGDLLSKPDEQAVAPAHPETARDGGGWGGSCPTAAQPGHFRTGGAAEGACSRICGGVCRGFSGSGFGAPPPAPGNPRKRPGRGPVPGGGRRIASRLAGHGGPPGSHPHDRGPPAGPGVVHLRRQGHLHPRAGGGPSGGPDRPGGAQPQGPARHPARGPDPGQPAATRGSPGLPGGACLV